LHLLHLESLNSSEEDKKCLEKFVKNAFDRLCDKTYDWKVDYTSTEGYKKEHHFYGLIKVLIENQNRIYRSGLVAFTLAYKTSNFPGLIYC